MKLFFHFALIGFANSYLVGPDDGGDALLIDPGTMDAELLTLIEQNNYYIRHVLVTHAHSSHVKGITTLSKIYDARIYANAFNVESRNVTVLKDGDRITCNGIEVEVLEVPGHSSDSLVYHIKGMLFTGDVLAAGRVGNTENSFSRALLLRSIREKIYPLPDRTLVFPGHGPPSLLKAEKMFNPDLQLLEKDPLLDKDG
ncbi:MAG: MBL fold metallo-hydrolase [Spirochaetaceae bacterium]